VSIGRFIAALLLAMSTPVLAEDAARCKLVRLADWHVRILDTHPIVDGAVNGKPVGVLIDTGAYASILTKSAAEKFGLPLRMTGESIPGIGGAESRLMTTRLDELKIDEFSAKGLRVMVAGEKPMRGIDFILGQDVLSTVDVEFDYANAAVRLFRPVDCKGRSLAYWDPGAQELQLHGDRRDVIPVAVNGQKADAMIDSGGYMSMVQLAFAQDLGITPTSPGVEPAPCIYGVGEGMIHQWVARFDSIALGTETISNARVNIGDLDSDFRYYRTGGPDMMLGGDFLRTHRVLISHSQGKVYFTYAGGQVFTAKAGFDCDDPRSRGRRSMRH
jgi:predicted aspartyl protease